MATAGLVIFLIESTDFAKARGRTLSSGAVLLKTGAPIVEDIVTHGLSVAHGSSINDLKVKPLILVIVAVLWMLELISQPQ